MRAVPYDPDRPARGRRDPRTRSRPMRPRPLLEGDWEVRTAVYRLTVETRRVPSSEAVGEALGMGSAAVRAALCRLQEHHHLGLFPDDEVAIANPFSAVETAYPVDTARGRYWATCAWDALGIPAILGIDGWTETRCAGSGAPLSFGVRDGRLAGDDAVVHMVVPLREAWADIGFT